MDSSPTGHWRLLHFMWRSRLSQRRSTFDTACHAGSRFDPEWRQQHQGCGQSISGLDEVAAATGLLYKVGSTSR